MCETMKLHQMTLPPKVYIGECWARDGLQNEAKVVPTDDKVEIITRMVETPHSPGLPNTPSTGWPFTKDLNTATRSAPHPSSTAQ